MKNKLILTLVGLVTVAALAVLLNVDVNTASEITPFGDPINPGGS